ncbi:hypothetical protein LG047_13885 [Methylocystis sp. WRRC1]|uniref:hypothetical protein n=1 Tax=Methylocystis sp. WRRC1 TaxID=1732014 RepID=UPI001D132F70|nr:hypothetical protein [Methylocystis sp. WRRC1]MCC3246398.1 hypothetical protein [Methylocystis sp. WRRC1]
MFAIAHSVLVQALFPGYQYGAPSEVSALLSARARLLGQWGIGESMFSQSNKSSAIAACLIALHTVTVGATERPKTRWQDGFVSRVEILALLQTLNANLLAGRSATTVLEKWCADHKMAAEPKVIARRIDGPEKPASAETRQRLRVEPNEIVKHRHVQLFCGDHVLSEADNWYVPARLTAEMNHTLETTETSFGRVVQPLRPFRQNIDAKILWSPLPQGWESGATATDVPSDAAPRSIPVPHELFEHRAVLYSEDQKPFSEVDERYTSENLDFDFRPISAQ